jgi:predicted RNase H-like HicB family nuclease
LIFAYPKIGTTSQGETVEAALANLKEACELFLEELIVARDRACTF